MIRKNIKYQKSPVHHLAVQLLLQVVHLHWRQLIIADNACGIQRCEQHFQLLHLALSHIGTGMDPLSFLDHRSHHQCTCCFRKLRKLFHGFLRIVAVSLLNAYQDDTLLCFV